jgi:hypothetical protein
MMLADLQDRRLHLLRLAALLAVLFVACSSLVMTLHAGRNNNSIFLVSLFAMWVLSPFLALLAANLVSVHWRHRSRLAAYILMLAVSIVSFVMYEMASHHQFRKPAFIFLIVPFFSWLLIMLGFLFWRPKKGISY